MVKKAKKMAGVPLPPEHQEMILAIKCLPDNEDIKLWTLYQKPMLINQDNYWNNFAIRIDYLQKIQAGFLLEDPIDDEVLHPLQRELIDVESRYKFAILNLLIEGWETIKNTAIREGREFPFGNPRELFAQLCREEAKKEVGRITSREINQGPTLKELRIASTILISFYGGKFEPELQVRFLARFQEGSWCQFWVFAIWQERNKSKLRDHWKEFINTLKTRIHFLKETKHCNGAKLVAPKWSDGNVAYSDTGKPVQLPDFFLTLS